MGGDGRRVVSCVACGVRDKEGWRGIERVERGGEGWGRLVVG